MVTPDESPVQRYVPLLCWLIILSASLFIGLKIISYGYTPGGDARRHAAKAFIDRPYSDLVVMRPFYTIDHSPGWEQFLRLAQRVTGMNQQGVIGFGLVAALLFVLCAPLFWLRRPEAWLAAVLTQVIAIPELMIRLCQARPFVVVMGVLMCLLLLWSKEETPRASTKKMVFTFLAFTFAVWMHGVWYLWVLLPPAFVLAGRWRDAGWITGCWLAGTFAGALTTGHPFHFLAQQVYQAMAIKNEHVPVTLLVGELQPSTGEFTTLIALAGIYLWGRLQKISLPPLARQPAFWMLFIGWTLGLFADRFWADWGLPAALVWMALSYEQIMEQFWLKGAPLRLLACACIALPLFLQTTSDQGQRYTRSLNDPFLDAAQPELKGWMPESGGIFYSAQMAFFYNTFFKNPTGDWRYMTGFEPALMPEEDLETLREIQASHFDPLSYEPWIKKMRPQDRLEIDSGGQPELPALEWKHAIGYIWIGRLRGATH